jgi:Periplasmic copper-binding protein (NosD)
MIFVSAHHGNDTNPGTIASPVRQIAKGIALAAAGDTVLVLDGGDYTPFDVAKSLKVVAHGVYAEVSAPAGPFGSRAVSVNAGPADVVVLHGLALRGAGATIGIAFGSGKMLRVENCLISNFVSTPEGFPGYGIEALASGVLTVADTVLRDNSGGIRFQGTVDIRGEIRNCRIEGSGRITAADGADFNATGVEVGISNRVTVADSRVTGYGLGFYVRGNAGSPLAALTISGSTVTNNRIGVYADRTGQVHLVGSTVSLNEDGLFTLNNGIIYTAGNNAILGNFTTNIGGGTVFFASDLS